MCRALLLMVVAACAPVGQSSQARESECRRDLQTAFDLIERNYPNFEDRVARRGRDALLRFEERMLSAASAKVDAKTCDGLIRQSLGYFEEGHLSLSVPSDRRLRDPAAQPTSDVPTLTLRAQASVIKIPSFDPEHRQTLEALVTQHDSDIRARRSMVLDLRRNGGGGDSTYKVLLPYIYTDPIQQVGVDILATAESADAWARVVSQIPDSEAELRRSIEEVSQRIRAAKSHTFIPLNGDSTITFPERFPQPARVLVVTDNLCASSCEQFLLTVKQSSKVTHVGARTAGVLDCANVRPFPLPSNDKRMLGIPTTRTRRTKPVDPDGIVPDVSIQEIRLMSDDVLLTKIDEVLADRPR